MNRGERRYRTYKKWESKLKKLWNANVLWSYVTNVKSNKKWFKPSEETEKAESWDSFKKDCFGVKCKNTGTILRDNKWLGIKDERKRNLENRKITKEDMDEANDALDPFAFEKYCGNCDRFPGDGLGLCGPYDGDESEPCPYKKMFENKQYNRDTEWRSIGCIHFMN